MKPSTLLRTLSRKFSKKHNVGTVTPWPPVRTAFDKWLESEIDELRFNVPISTDQCTSAKWLAKALDLAISSQKMLVRSMSNFRSSNLRPVGGKIVADHLDDLVQLLDALSRLKERIEVINRYINSIYVALHWIEETHEPSLTALRRAQTALVQCEAIERRCFELEKCGSNLRRLGEKISRHCSNKMEECSNSCNNNTEFNEALIGSRAVMVFVVSILGIAFSFKSRRGVPLIQLQKNGSNNWENSFHEMHKEVKEEFDKRRKGSFNVMIELDATSLSANKLRNAVSKENRRELKSSAEMLRKKCMDLEKRIRPFDMKANELFREIVGVRMSLLEICTM